jgi:hypothetical protein
MIVPSKDTTFSQFISSMVIDFPYENIPLVTSEENWKSIGSDLVQLATFADNGAPSPYGFEDRTEWEQAVFNSMASFG